MVAKTGSSRPVACEKRGGLQIDDLACLQKT
jgi:hypothetical protein